MPAKRVRDVMHEGVVTCPPDLTLADAARVMTDSGVRALIVTEPSCRLCGILAQSDLVHAAFDSASADAWRDIPVSRVMTSSVLTVTPETPVNEAAKTMVAHHIHRLVVVNADNPFEPVGVLSMGDLVRGMMRDDPA